MADMDGPASERDLIVTLEARVEKLTKAKDEQKHRARKAERKVTRLREALKGLASGPYGAPPCWCEMRVGNPMVKSHSDACLAARAALHPEDNDG
jgi:hypothetical protein